MSHTFISYSRNDIVFAGKIVQALAWASRLKQAVLWFAFEGRLA